MILMKKTTILFSIIIFALPILILAEDKDVSLEYNTKAVFIYNFMKYIQWPDDDTTRPFCIAVIGDGGILRPLKEIEKKKTIRNRKIEVRQVRNIKDIDTCHILFISKSEKKRLQDILDSTNHRNILTVSDTEGWAQRGVVINFKIINDKIRFQINSAVLDILQLRVSSQLLKLALFVEGKNRDD